MDLVLSNAAVLCCRWYDVGVGARVLYPATSQPPKRSDQVCHLSAGVFYRACRASAMRTCLANGIPVCIRPVSTRTAMPHPNWLSFTPDVVFSRCRGFGGGLLTVFNSFELELDVL
jgi:hypothetical protein